MAYYVLAKDGGRYGPADIQLLNQWVADNRISASTPLIEASTGQQIIAFALQGLKFGSTAAPVPKTVDVVTTESVDGWGEALSQTSEIRRKQIMEKEAPKDFFRTLPVAMRVETYMLKNLVHLVFGFLPLTLVALHWSNKAETANTTGDFAEAEEHARKAHAWGNYSFVTLLVITFCVILIPQLIALSGWEMPHAK